MLKRIFWLVLFIFLLTPLFMYIFWVTKPEKLFKVLILDKTVLETKTQEHLSLSWILINEKYNPSANNLHNNKINYFGFFPDDKGQYIVMDFNTFSDSEIENLANSYDMAYFTDLYGVYSEEWLEQYPSVASNKRISDNSMERSQIIYGGMTQNEILLLQKMKRKSKLIITEFNVIASPTSNNVRRKFENEFKMNWTGWVGRYYSTLDTLKNKELPRWLKKNYLIQHNNKWPFSLSGIVFVREDDRIEILENNTHLNTELPIIYSSEHYMDKYALPNRMKYPFWFDIIKTNSNNKIVSNYNIDVNNAGKKLLREYGIPETFPAVIEHDSTDYKFYYFAGDFSDNPIEIKFAKFRWIECFSGFTYKDSYQERHSFFWDYYRSLVKNILSKYTDENISKHQVIPE